jgi:hypothetical protein
MHLPCVWGFGGPVTPNGHADSWLYVLSISA